MSYVTIYIIIISIMIILLLNLSSYNLAYSQIFNKQNIIDNEDEFNVENITNFKEADQTLINEKQTAKKSINITAVNYYSDGETFNAIYWLELFSLNPKFEKLYSLADKFNLDYGMLIDIPSNNKNGLLQFDYDISIHCECKPRNANWTQTYSEISNSNIRILNITQLKGDNLEMISGKYHAKDKKNYILLPVDLHKIGYPEEYRVLFYSKYSYNFHPEVIIKDLTNLVTIPPPKMTLSLIPSAIEVRKGENKDLTIQVNTSNQFNPLVNLFFDKRDTNLKFEFNRDKLNLPSFGMDRTTLVVSVPNYHQIGSFMIPIFANATSSDNIIRSEFIETTLDNESMKMRSEEINKQAILLVDVKPELQLGERINNAWKVWGEPISGFHALIASIIAGLSPFIINTIRKKLKKG